MNDVEEIMLELRDELKLLGLTDNVCLWCHYGEFDKCEPFFSWTLFCKYGGQKYQFSTKSWERILEKAREITQLDLATRELLLSL